MAYTEISKCRVCLTEQQNMKLLSSDYLICGEILTVSEIISSCANIEIIFDERLPNYICNSCLQDANISYSFKKRCKESENYLKSQVEEIQRVEKEDKKLIETFEGNGDILKSYLQCTKHPVKFTNNLRSMRKCKKVIISEESDSEDNNYSEEIKQEIEFVDANLTSEPETSWRKILRNSKEKTENGVYECLCCSETFENISDLRNHIHSHNYFPCKLCKKKFTLLSNLRRHLKTHDNSVEKTEDDRSEFKCIACEKIFSRRKLLSEHLKTHTEFICRICNSRFSFATNLRKHINWHHKPKNEIKTWKQTAVDKRTCDICMKVFKYRPSMLKHRKKHDFPGKSCKFCDEIFENSIKLYKHMEELHENEKNVVCTQCGKKFFKEWNLKMHMIVHSGTKPYMCEICGASFALGGNLTSHKRLHSGAKPYKCETCGRSFAQQSALRSHEAGHSNRKDFICPECGAAFSRPGAMRNHRKRHQSTKPFSCGMCPKKFTFSSERKRHMTIHTGEKNYVCDFCGKAFNRPTNLTVHRRIHTGEQPYKCDICGKGFAQAHCMRTHRNTHSAEENSNLTSKQSQ